MNTIILEITNRCNLRCSMCGIWQDQEARTLDRKTISSVLRSARDLKAVCITGGEPFMEDIYSIYETVREVLPKVHINISTNGTLTEAIKDFWFTKPKNISFTISYDGLQNDIIRDVKGAGRKTLQSARFLRDSGADVKLKITTNGSMQLASDMEDMKRLKIPVLVKLEEVLSCHQSRNNPKSSDIRTIGLNAIEAENMRYIRKCLRKLAGEDIRCTWDKIFIDVGGDVYLCRRASPLGNIHSNALDDIIKEADTSYMKTCSDKECFSFSDR